MKTGPPENDDSITASYEIHCCKISIRSEENTDRILCRDGCFLELFGQMLEILVRWAKFGRR